MGDERVSRLERQLAECEERFRRLVQTVTDYAYAVRVEGGRAVETRHGPGCVGVTGYTSDEFAANPNLWIEMVPVEDRTAVVAQAESILRGEPAGALEHRIVRKDGAVRWVSDTPVPMRGASGALVSFDGLVRDVTERRNAETALRESEERYRRLFDTSAHALFLIGSDGRFHEANRIAIERYGYSPEELRLMTPGELAAADLKSQAPQRVEEALGGGTRFQWRHRTKGGREIPVQIMTKPIDIGGRRYTFAEAQDVTAQLRAEAALRDSEATLRAILEAAEESVFMMGLDGTVLACNSTTARRLGFEHEALVGRNVYDIIPAAQVESRKERVAEVLATGKKVGFEDERGGIVFEHTIFPVFGADGRATKLAIFGRDITARIRAEEALRKSEELFRTLFETMAQGVVFQEQDGRISSANAAAERILGISREELCSRASEDPRWEAIREDGSPFQSSEHPSMLALATGREVRGTVMGLYNPALGERRWIVIDAVPQFEPGARSPHRVYTTFTDVSAAKRDAEDLVRAKEYAENLIDTANAILVELDESGNIVRFNRAAQEITGYALEELRGASWFETIVPRDRFPQVWEIFERLPSGELPHNFENPILTKAGEERIIAWRNSEIRFRGRITGVISFGVDVTDSRRSMALVQAERDLGLAMSSATSLTEALELCLATALRVSGMDSGGVYIVETDGGLTLAVHSGLSEEFLRAVGRFGPESPNAAVARRGRPAYVTHEKMGIELDEKRRSERLHAVAVIPIRERGEVVACLNIASHNRDSIPEWARVALEDVASRVGPVIVRARAEDAQRHIEREYKTLFDQMLDGFAVHEIVCDEKGAPIDYRFLAVNPAFARMTGLTAERAVGRTVRELMPNTEQSWIEAYGKVALEGVPAHFESFARELKRHFEVTAFQPRYGQFACIFTDITERRLLEEQYNQAQKMEAVGRLAGGVAHDLNNLLTPILGYAELLENAFTTGDARLDSVKEMSQAGLRAKDLVRQLLAFSRKQTLDFKRIDVNETIRGFEKLLRRTLREDVRVRVRLAVETHTIRGDVGQIEQVLMNLAINAQDAMPDGGDFAIETREIELGEEHGATHADIPPGKYVLLTVSDTGSGMDADTMARIFEPFFTTKPAGKGTGLGLATVYGIVKQHGGTIAVYSELGVGTSFKLYFPRLDSEPPAIAEEAAETGAPDGAPVETVMVVEDSEMVRNLAVKVLRRQGYTVLSAGNAEECMKSLQSFGGPLHLLLTDVVMPDMNGRALYEVVSTVYPDIKVVYMSGYPRDVISRRGVLDENIAFIQKPFSVKALAAKIRSVLDKSSAAT
jgi:two-component system, cell cycle sensor histidine kinase and response regulator CckA